MGGISSLRKKLVPLLEIGDYVHSLDRPWLDTPFLVQGFYIRSNEDISELAKYCEHVYLDDSRMVDAMSFNTMSKTERDKNIKKMFECDKLETYLDQGTWREEAEKAKAAYEYMQSTVGEVFDKMLTGRGLDLLKVKKAVDPMIESIIRNPDACLWLARIKQEDQYTYQHSVGCAVWTVALGRQLGLGKPDLRTLAIGGLLFDIGKLQIDVKLLKLDRRLTQEEFEETQNHVTHGVHVLRAGGVMNQKVLEMAAYHHERYGGRGYPKRLAKNDIPVYARIAGLVDTYDAMTSKRAYAQLVSPSEAIKMLFEWRNVHFQAELVEEFIQAIGLYPPGTLVKLSSGQVGIVLAESRSRRLRPNVMILLDGEKQATENREIIDLKQTTQLPDGEPLEIVASVTADAYDIDMASIEPF